MTSPMPEELGGMLAGMARLQHELEAAQAHAAEVTVVGSAGGGVVTVDASGEFSFDAVHIDPSLVGATDVSVVEDLILAAVRNAVEQLFERRKQALGGLMTGALGTLLSGSGDDEPLET
jgi:DNA-binding YbaB/EbfC family protein